MTGERTARRWTIWAAVLAVLALSILTGRESLEKGIQIRTDGGPVYRHLPSLPEAREIRWCGSSTTGIGLVTTRISIFAFYDYDVKKLLPPGDWELVEASIDPPFIPKSLNGGGDEWEQVKNADFLFQDGVKDYEKMNTAVYLNSARNVVYIEAVGD